MINLLNKAPLTILNNNFSVQKIQFKKSILPSDTFTRSSEIAFKGNNGQQEFNSYLQAQNRFSPKEIKSLSRIVTPQNEKFLKTLIELELYENTPDVKPMYHSNQIMKLTQLRTDKNEELLIKLAQETVTNEFDENYPMFKTSHIETILNARYNDGATFIDRASNDLSSLWNEKKNISGLVPLLKIRNQKNKELIDDAFTNKYISPSADLANGLIKYIAQPKNNIINQKTNSKTEKYLAIQDLGWMTKGDSSLKINLEKGLYKTIENYLIKDDLVFKFAGISASKMEDNIYTLSNDKKTSILSTNVEDARITRIDNILTNSNVTSESTKFEDKSEIKYNVEYDEKNDYFRKISNTNKQIKDSSGNVLLEEVFEKSEIENQYNIYQIQNGRKNLIGLAEKTPSGNVIIDKNFISADGTKTNSVFITNPKGERLTHYKITDKNGKVLLNTTHKFKKIDDNHFQSEDNNNKYDMRYFSNMVVVTKNNISNNKTDRIFIPIGKNKIINNNIINQIKTLPGSIYFNMKNQNLNGLALNDEYNDSFYLVDTKEILISPEEPDATFIMLHELGHFKDATLNKSHNISDDPKIRIIFDEEQENYQKIAANSEIENSEYVLFSEDLCEFAAESNALLFKPSETNYSLRSEYLLQNFPKTFAAFAKKLL